jgi:hypothetical protein
MLPQVIERALTALAYGRQAHSKQDQKMTRAFCFTALLHLPVPLPTGGPPGTLLNTRQVPFGPDAMVVPLLSSPVPSILELETGMVMNNFLLSPVPLPWAEPVFWSGGKQLLRVVQLTTGMVHGDDARVEEMPVNTLAIVARAMGSNSFIFFLSDVSNSFQHTGYPE